MMEFTSPQLIFVSVSVSAVLAIVGFLGTDDISFTDTEAAKAAAGKQFSFLCAPMYILFVIIGFVFSGCSNLNMTYSPILLQELGMRRVRWAQCCFSVRLLSCLSFCFRTNLWIAFQGAR